MYELVFLTGARAGEVVPISKTLICGRSPDCALEVPDPNASRQHARVVWDGADLSLVDNNSSNGTFLNDQRVTSNKLNHGDIVRIGETRMRIQSHNRRGGDSSSIFAFKEAEADLSQSIVMPLDHEQSHALSAEALAARLNSVIKVSKALVDIDKLDQVFARILETLFEVFPQADRGFLMLGNEVGHLEAKAMRQRGKGVTENLSVSTTICRKALEAKSAFLFNDQNSAGFDQGMSIVSLRIRSAMTIPLMVGEAILGLLQIDTPDSKRAFTRDDLELAVAVCHQAAIALHNAQLLSRVEAEATKRNNLMRYLPGALADQVSSGTMDLAMGGKNYIATLLFSDLIGFTRMSEGLQPEQVVQLMNRYFTRMVPCIQNNAGSVDKFMGDAIMAVWGVPIDKGDAATNGVHAALAMQTALAGFNSIQQHEQQPQLAMGIGLNTGAVVAGNIGTEERKEYTVISDAVNTAQRLESNAGRSQILISNSTWNELHNNGYGVAMPPLRVKNKAEPLTNFSLRGLKILNDEIMLHAPLYAGEHLVWVIRRLADHSFIVIHPSACNICASDLTSAMVEWPEAIIGTPEMIAVLPTQHVDGLLVRSHIRLADPTLGGLLASTPITCQRPWEAMPRADKDPRELDAGSRASRPRTDHETHSP